MAASKKKVKQAKEPVGNKTCQGGNPEQYYYEHPAWNFSSCDKEQWSIYSKEVRRIFWGELLPNLQGWETQTWSDILLHAKKQNHSIHTDRLSKTAADRLAQLHIEAEAVISLRLTGTHRIYGYISGTVFHILWVDLSHGDHAGCVCRALKKHT